MIWPFILHQIMMSDATSENSVTVLHDTIQRFKTSAQMLSDNESQFTSRCRREPAKSWKLTVFENDLPRKEIELINSHPYHGCGR